MVPLITFPFFVFGLIIGSFLNVVIYRHNTGKTLGGRSACMSCLHKLRFWELVPVFSFIFLGGRCGKCKIKLSAQYPLVELMAGVISASVFLYFQEIFFVDTGAFFAPYFFYTLSYLLLLVIAVYDIRHKIIPDNLVVIFGTCAFLALFLFKNFSLSLHIPSLFEILSGPLVALPFALLWFFSRGEWMGFGDAKLAIGLGWLLPIGQALSGVVVSFWIGAIFGVFLLALKPRFGLKSEIPFAPFLVLGSFLAFVLELQLFFI